MASVERNEPLSDLILKSAVPVAFLLTLKVRVNSCPSVLKPDVPT